MEKRFFLRLALYAQIIFWSVLTLCMYLIGIFIMRDATISAIGKTMAIISVYMCATYTNYFVLIPKLFLTKKYWTYLIVFFSFSALLVYTHGEIVKLFNPKDCVMCANVHTLHGYLFFYPHILLFMIASGLFRFAIEWYKVKEEQQQLQRSKIQTELNFLKAQMQPHFLFNTLNNIYYLAYKNNPQTPKMIQKLSSILRYIVYDSKKEKVGLDKEIEAITSLINLYKIKNLDQENIIFTYMPVQAVSIVPLLLVHFVENAFKHSSVLYQPNGFIHVSLEVDAYNMLQFKIVNSIRQSSINEIEERGVGNENVIRQLDLQYKDKYELTSSVKEGIYEMVLMLQL